MGTEPFGLQAGLRLYKHKRRISLAKAPNFNDPGISVVSSNPKKMGRKSCIFNLGGVARFMKALSIFLLRLCERRSRAKAALNS
jgi:hypothetical protein